MAEDVTTIKLYKKTKERLDKLKVYRRESYDEVLQKVLEILNMTRTEPDRARAKLVAIDRQRVREKRGSD